jgi:hypothetical protein
LVVEDIIIHNGVVEAVVEQGESELLFMEIKVDQVGQDYKTLLLELQHIMQVVVVDTDIKQVLKVVLVVEDLVQAIVQT